MMEENIRGSKKYEERVGGLGQFDPIPLRYASPRANPLPDGGFRAVIQSKPIRANGNRPPSSGRKRAILPASLVTRSPSVI